MSQSTKTITLTYAYNPANPGASVLHEEITDADHPDTPFTHDYMVDIPSLLGVAANGNTIGYVGLTGSTGTNNYWELQDILGWRFTPNGPAAPHNLTVTSGSNANDLSWKCTSADEEGFYVERSTSPTGGFMRIATLPAGTTTYHDVVSGNPQGYYYRVQAFNHDGMGQEQDSGYSNVGNGAVVTINFPNFTTHGNLSANNNNTGVNIFPGNPPVMRLTDGRGSEASSSFYTTPVGTGAFTTTFTLRDQPVNGAADSANFVIQNDPRGTAALGGSGGGGGYSGIVNSIAIKFDLYTHGSHNPTTGLFTGGQAPDSDASKDVALTGISLGSGHALQITISYDGVSTIQEHVVDTVTNATFDHTYNLGTTLAQVIGGTSAYVGFTGGTGGETATQDILMWTGTFALAPPQAAGLRVVAMPTTVTAGQPVSITVTAVDQNGNVFPNYTGTVHFTSSDPQAVLPDDYTFTAEDMGTHSFAAILATAGVQSITAPDVASGVSGTQDGIEVVPGDLAFFAVQGFPSPVQAGTPGTFTVAAYDAYGNLVTDYTGTVSFYSSDPQASLPPDYTFTPDDMGMHTFTATLFTAGTQSIGAYDTTTGAFGQQDGIEVTPSTAVGFIITIASPVTAGEFVFFTVTAVDAYGNPNAIYTGTVTFSSSDPDANLPNDYTFTADDNGSHTFAVVFNTPGMQSLTVTDTDDPTISGTQDVEVDPAGLPNTGGHKGTAYPAYLAVGGTGAPAAVSTRVRCVEAGTPAAPEREHPLFRPAAESVAVSSACTPPDYQALDRLFAGDGAGMLPERGLDDPVQAGSFRPD